MLPAAPAPSPRDPAWHETSAAPEPPLPSTAQQIDTIVRRAHAYVGLDATCVSRFADGRQVYTSLAGDPEPFGMRLDEGPPLEDTYCARLIAGELPNAIGDCSAEPAVRDLPVTREAGIGAYVGVPLHLPDGTLYGSFCSVSRRPDPSLDERAVAVLDMLGEVLRPLLAGQMRAERDLRLTRTVLAEGRLEIAMQPVVDLVNGRMLFLESLSRFPEAAGPPEVAFARAERARLRPELELTAVRAALAAAGDLPSGVRVSINLSPDVACTFADDAEDWLGFPLDQLVLEITEHEQIVSYAEVREHLEPLRARGAKLAVDDTGAGFASLRHLVELAPDVIKIDRSLIAGIDTDRSRRSVVTTFVLLALDIGASVIAEGIETQDELRTVASLGVDAAQGFLIARPTTDPQAWARWSQGAPLLGGVASEPAMLRLA